MEDDVPRVAGGVSGARVDGPLRVEHGDPGAGTTLVGVDRPRLSWRIADAPPGWRQRRAEVRMRRRDGATELAELPGDAQLLVAWPFPPLGSRDRVEVEVRCEGADDAGSVAWTAWSDPARVEVSLLHAADWSARWITPAVGGGIGDPAPVLGTSIEVGPDLVSARLYLTACGLVEASVNGSPVTPDLLTPGWTSYDRLVRFRGYDVTPLLRPGGNELRGVLGNGWYRGRIASLDLHRGRPYGERLGLLAQLELEYADGSRAVHGTDASWRAGDSAILADDFYDGQTTDLRRPPSEPSRPVELLDAALGRLEPATAPPVRELETLRPVTVSRRGDAVRLDFGRDIVGWVRLRVPAGAERELVIRHAEVLDAGELALRPLRTAQATDRWRLPGGVAAVLEPRFTYHGFRYAEITGLAPDEELDAEAVVIGSALRRTGWLETSDPGLNRLHANVVASTVGNFVDIPTDCPQRDERLGWTGDAQVFAPTASTLFDVSSFLGDWLESLALDQLADGTVPAVVPRVFREEKPFAGWGDAAVVVPWVLHQRDADPGILRRQYPSMRAWVEKVRSLADGDGLWRGGAQLGDWLDPLAPPEQPAAAQADPDVVASAHYARSVRLLAEVAGVIGETGDADRYTALADAVRDAFDAAFVAADGRILSDCQTVYALALSWDLIVDPDRRRRAGERLAELVEAQGFTVATGFLGTPHVLHALTRAGRTDDAYRMLVTRRFPSWLYAVDLGATTIWERWDSLLPDGSVNPGDMTSFNHYAFGAVADWMHRVIGGVTPLSPGCRRIRVAPHPGAGLTRAAFRYDSPYGRIETAWRLDAGRFVLDLVVPVGVVASVELPDGTVHEGVAHGAHRYEIAADMLPLVLI